MCRIFLVKVLSSLTEPWIWLCVGHGLGLSNFWRSPPTRESWWFCLTATWLCGADTSHGEVMFFSRALTLYCTWFLTQPSRVRVGEWRIGAKIAWPCVIPAMLVCLASVVKFSFVLSIRVKMKTGTSVCIHPSVSQEGRTQLIDTTLSAGSFLRSDLWAFSGRSFFRRRLNNLFFSYSLLKLVTCN